MIRLNVHGPTVAQKTRRPRCRLLGLLSTTPRVPASGGFGQRLVMHTTLVQDP